MIPDKTASPVGARFEEQFQDHPESAVVTLRAQGHVAKDGVCKVEDCKAVAEAGPHPLLGGDPSLGCAAEMLLGSLVACAGVTLSQMATAMEIDFREAFIRAEGDLDFRGSLGLADHVPIGINTLRLHFDVDAEATEEQLAMMVQLTERYCVVSRTLKPVTKTTFAAISAER